MKIEDKALSLLRGLIFWSRWLQAPLYLGLIFALGVYVYHFSYATAHLFQTVPGQQQCIDVPGKAEMTSKLIEENKALKQHIMFLSNTKGAGAPPLKLNQLSLKKNNCPRPDQQVKITAETSVMLIVLDLIDIVMIANLLIMVIIGGYETFVSRLHLKKHPDRPEWLSQVNASVLKVKLAMALIGISSIHLLRTFILVPHYPNETIFWHVVIHISFLLSAIAMAYTDKIMHPTPSPSPQSNSV